MKNYLVALGATALLAGCASSPALPPTLQSGADAEVTVDGLYRVDNSLVAMAWMKPDLDLRPYTAIQIDRVTIAYQTDPQGRRSDARATGIQNFALTDTQMENLKDIFQEAVVDALEDGYEIVDTPGPNVLRVTADLIDLIIRIPTQETAGRSRSAVRSIGEVTLVVEARDSQSGEIIARTADRRDPTRTSTRNMTAVTPGTARADMRSLFEDWAAILRQRLDELREVEVESND